MAISQAEVPPATRLSWGNVHQNPWAHGPYPCMEVIRCQPKFTYQKGSILLLDIYIYIHMFIQHINPCMVPRMDFGLPVGYPQIPKFMNLSSFPYKHDNFFALAIP